MPFPTTLTAGMLTKLRSSRYAAKLRVFILEDEVVFAARVNGAVNTVGYGFINYDGVTTGSYSDIKPGMTIYIGSENDISKAFYIARARYDDVATAVANASSIYLNESSVQIADNAYIWITDDYRLAPKLPYLTLGGVQKKDFSRSFQQLSPYFTVVKQVYAAEVSSGSAQFTFDWSAQAATSGATISSRLTDAADGSYISGSSSSAAPVISFPQGARWVSCLLTDSGGRTTTISVFVVVNGPDFPATHTIDGVNIQTSSSGWASQLAAFDGIENIRNGALVVIYDASELYGTESGSLIDNIKFVGRLRFETTDVDGDAVYGRVGETRFTLDDFRAQLSRIHGTAIALRNIASPDEWDEINDLTPQRAIVHYLREHTTALELTSIQFDETFNNTYEMGDFPIQGQDAMSCVNSVALSRLDARLEFTPAGEMRVTRDALLMDGDDRDALTTVAGFTDGSTGATSDYLGFSLSVDNEKPVGHASVKGGSYNTTSGTYTTREVVAPGTAQAIGAGRENLEQQIYAANMTLEEVKTEGKRLAGALLDRANANTRLTVKLPDGWHFLIPSRGYWYTHVISASRNTRGRSFTTSHRWLLESISIVPDNESGARQVQAVFLLEETGNYEGAVFEPSAESDGVITTPYLAVEDVYPGVIPEPPYVVDIPVEDAIPAKKSDPLPRDGNTVVFGTESQVWNSTGFLRSNNPQCNEITPEDIGTIRAALIDQLPQSTKVYLLENVDEDTSAVQYSENGLAPSPEWSQGDQIHGIFNVMRGTGLDSGVGIYAPTISDETVSPGTYDFTTGTHGWYPVSAATPPAYSPPSGWGGGDWITGLGWRSGNSEIAECGPGLYHQTIKIQCIFDQSYTSVNIKAWGYCDTAAQTVTRLSRGLPTGGSYSGGAGGETTNTVGTSETLIHNEDYASAISGLTFLAKIHCNPAPQGKFIVTRITVTGTPAGGSSVGDSFAYAAFSDDDGETFDEIVVGDPIAVGGFDIIRSGGVSFGGADNQAKIATTIEGAYANAGSALTAGDPILLITPWYRYGSTSVKNFSQGGDTEVVIGSSALNASNQSLWWLEEDGTLTDITPFVDSLYWIPVGPNALIIWKGTYLAGAFRNGSTYKILVSSDDGDTWSSVETVTADTDFIIQRRSQPSPKQFYFNAGAQIGYTNDWGTTIVYKTLPTTDDIKYIDVLG